MKETNLDHRPDPDNFFSYKYGSEFESLVVFTCGSYRAWQSASPPRTLYRSTADTRPGPPPLPRQMDGCMDGWMDGRMD